MFSLSFRGRHEDVPVLCSETRSYAVKEAELSNSLFLVPNLSLKADLTADECGALQFRRVRTSLAHCSLLRLCVRKVGISL